MMLFIIKTDFAYCRGFLVRYSSLSKSATFGSIPSHRRWQASCHGRLSTDRNCINYLIYGKMLIFINILNKEGNLFAYYQTESQVPVIRSHTNN